ncbi:hypothetical protein pb186bvf_002819 [Paramecium bursaria]
MGNQSSELATLGKNYSIQRQKHQYYGDIAVCQSKVNPKERYLLKEFIFTDEQEFKNNRKKWDQRQTIKSDYTLKLERVFIQQENQLCGKFFKLCVLSEYPPTRLESVQITPNDYWPIIFGYVRGLELLQQNKINHGQITTKTLYIPPKVVDPTLFEQNNNYQQMLQHKGQNIYLSPLLFKNYQKNEWQPIHNQFKSDVFTLGLCLMQAIMREYHNDLYIETFQEALLLIKLKKLQQIVHKCIFEVIVAMVTLLEQNRPDFIELSSYVDLKYSEYINQNLPQRHNDDYQVKRQISYNTNYSVKSFKTQPSEDFANQISAILLNQDKCDEISFIQLPQIPSLYCKWDENLEPSHDDELEAIREINDEEEQSESKRENILIQYDQTLKENFNITNKIVNCSNQSNKFQDPITDSSIQKVSSYSQPFELKIEMVNEIYQDGSRYQGQKVNGMRHGIGVFFYQDGGFYDGSWDHNHMHGKGIQFNSIIQGTLYYSSGTPAYHGDWFEDKFHGYGILYNELPAAFNDPFDFTNFDYVEDYWVRYEGEFNDDNKEGKGILYLTNGERYQGLFLKDCVHGHGQYITKTGRIVESIWCNNQLVR